MHVYTCIDFTYWAYNNPDIFTAWVLVLLSLLLFPVLIWYRCWVLICRFCGFFERSDLYSCFRMRCLIICLLIYFSLTDVTTAENSVVEFHMEKSSNRNPCTYFGKTSILIYTMYRVLKGTNLNFESWSNMALMSCM